MNMIVFWVLAGLLCFGSLWLGLRGKSEDASVQEFFACRSNLGLASLMLTILATQLGGGSVIGTAEAAYNHGWMAIFYSLGLALGLVVMAFTVGPALRKFGAMTVAQVMGNLYQSRRVQLIASFLSVITLFLILVAIGVSCRKVFVSLGFDSPWFLVSFWSVLIGYTTFGGLRAVVITDKMQVVFILTVFVLILAFLGNHFLPLIQSDAFVPKADQSLPWSSWVFMPLCFMLISQDMGQRCFAAESDRSIRLAMIGGGVFLILATSIPVFVGMLGKYMGLSVCNNSIFMTVIYANLPPAIISFVAIAVLMAIISTADSLLCAISSNIALDFLKSKSMGQSRFVTFIIGALSLALSFYEGDVIPIMLVGYSLSVFGLLIPFLMGIYLKSVTKGQALLSLSIGVIGFIGISIFPFQGAEFFVLFLAAVPYIKNVLK
jgi:SSS family solute:Na+ symporter